MRILKIDWKENFLHLVPETEDDLWHLERVIEKHDLVSGIADRKIKPRVEGEKAQRIKIFVTLDVDSLEFHRFLGQLRVSGAIVDGTPAELLEIGAQQSIEIAPGTEIKVKKQALKKFQAERLLKAAEATKKGRVLLLVLDDEQASFAIMHEFELEEKGNVRSGRSGKQFKGEDVKAKYFSEVFEKLLEIKPEKVVVAGPGFAKEEFQKYMEEKEKKGMQLFFASTNSVGKTGLQELLKGNALEKIVQEMQLVKETKLVEGILAELGKGTGLAEYGLKEVQQAVEAGAVKQLLVSDAFFLENRGESEKIMQEAEKMGAEVHLVNGEHEAGKQLGGLGGVAALLRYRIK
ncbi:MAG: mRNA surveillance protein pelota [archaeon]